MVFRGARKIKIRVDVYVCSVFLRKKFDGYFQQYL